MQVAVLSKSFLSPRRGESAASLQWALPVDGGKLPEHTRSVGRKTRDSDPARVVRPSERNYSRATVDSLLLSPSVPPSTPTTRPSLKPFTATEVLGFLLPTQGDRQRPPFILNLTSPLHSPVPPPGTQLRHQSQPGRFTALASPSFPTLATPSLITSSPSHCQVTSVLYGLGGAIDVKSSSVSAELVAVVAVQAIVL
ncbi:hypothetical protein E2C01_054576 [Portunus trituberculatus]|uniref:Uncharacterized protein n=1 Tax=Portunus trituberculatus TaxID=210409 RepID=A0A5B7GSE5_PORTR|nr:hypothetical protein [Portunus trituberculatus]